MTRAHWRLGVAAIAIVLATSARSQATGASEPLPAALDDIVVTAQKREQKLQDVPISVSVLSGSALADRSTSRFEDLNASVPNFSVSRNAIQDTVSIRGINSDGQAGSEQSVGIFVDGIFRGRGTQSRFAFLDVERIEVLRGPQGALFGKNTIAGALNITSARPTEALSAGVSATYEFNHQEAEVTSFLSGPLTDNLRARLAVSWRDMSKGWMQNVGYDENMPRSNEWAARASIEADLSDQISLYAKYEHGRSRDRGAAYDFVAIGPSLAGAVRTFSIPDVAAGFDGINNISNANLIVPGVPYLAAIDFGSAFKMDGTNDEVAVQMDAELGAGVATLLYGYSAYNFDRVQDADFGPLPVLSFGDQEDYSQHSVELRYASDSGGRFDYIVGGYFQSSSLFAQSDTRYNFRLISALRGGVPIMNPPTSNPSRVVGLDQDSTTWAAFGQATFRITDNLTLTGGLRYSWEKKTAVQFARILDATTGATATPPPSPPFPSEILAWYLLPTETVIHQYDLERSEGQLTPQVQLDYRVSDDVMLYGSYAKGAKGGGFNSIALGSNPLDPSDDTGVEYADESADSFELGIKSEWFDNRLRLNLSYFNMRFRNLQTTSFTGSTGFIVTNAARAKVQGLEFDGMWAITNELRLSANAGWIDFKFQDYSTAGCTAEQITHFANAAACSAAGGNDLSGRTNQDVPKFTTSLNMIWQPQSSWLREIFFDANYSDQYYAAADLDPATVQSAFWKLNAGISVGPEEGRWQLSLIGRNLTDQHTYSYANDVPLFVGSHFALWQRPRSIAARFRFNF